MKSQGQLKLLQFKIGIGENKRMTSSKCEYTISPNQFIITKVCSNFMAIHPNVDEIFQPKKVNFTVTLEDKPGEHQG